MFRRSKTETTSARPVANPGANPGANPADKPDGKGRPTPSRKEAQAAAKARARTPQSRKEMTKLQRAQRAEATAKMRQGMKIGEERFLPARDKGPVRHFLRDRVDSRVCMAEFLMPALILIMVMIYSGSSQLVAVGNSLWLATILLVATDSTMLVVRIRKDVRQRFPDESHKGVTGYTLLRAMQLRFLRVPKPQLRIGQKLPDRY